VRETQATIEKVEKEATLDAFFGKIHNPTIMRQYIDITKKN